MAATVMACMTDADQAVHRGPDLYAAYQPMNLATLIQRCTRSEGRRVGESSGLFTAGVATWSGHGPAAWVGRRYTGDGHGLSLVLRGRGTFTAWDGSRHEVEPGLAVHHLPGRAAAGVLSGPAAELWVSFGRTIALHLVPLGLLRQEPVVRIGLDPGLLGAFAHLHAALRAPSRFGDAPRLLALAIAWVQEAYARADANGTEAAWNERIATACRLMERDFASPPDLAAIARELGTTALVLRRRFGLCMGCPPSVWWQQQRVQRASELLVDHPVAEVARLVGYADPTALAKQVRRHFGRTPRSFRR
jgi:AraC-like DNA-binding protein